MMAFSGVRSSWLMLARNCDLCWLASSSWRLLSWISSNSRTFSIAITAWSAKVVTSSICLSVNGRTSRAANASTPIGIAFAQQWNGEHRAIAGPISGFCPCVVRVGQDIGDMDRLDLPAARPVAVPRPARRERLDPR